LENKKKPKWLREIINLKQEKSKLEQKPEIYNQKKEVKRSQISRKKEEEEKMICEGILSMDMNSNYNQTKFNTFSLIIPINMINLASLSILFVLILFGSYYVWKIFTRKKCMCKVCKNEYEVINKLGEGGFGEVFK
jgi:uncharacterized membrane protein